MIISLFRRDRQPDTISILYGMIVAQARLPVFYRDFAVPDTVNGRFDLIVLHLALVLRRLKGDQSSYPQAGQQLFDRFCADMDGNLREMGVADLKVPKEMRQIGEAFYGRAHAYDAALAEPGLDALAQVLSRNILDGAVGTAPRLAAYIRAVDRALSEQQLDAIAAGRVVFPDPAGRSGQEVA
ncbi:MAG: ubiquinol-cytochrome C chaperone family protein [Pseudolabrys sp.]